MVCSLGAACSTSGIAAVGIDTGEIYTATGRDKGDSGWMFLATSATTGATAGKDDREIDTIR
jgi:hypothetical protein